MGRCRAGKKSRQLLEESDSEEEEAPKAPPAKRSKPSGGGAKRAAGSGGAAKKSSGAKRKQPAKAAEEGGEGAVDRSAEAEAGVPAAAKRGTVKSRTHEPGAVQLPGRCDHLPAFACKTAAAMPCCSACQAQY